MGPPKPSYCHEAKEHEGQTAHVDSRPANMREEKPADDATDDVASGEGDVDIKGLKLRKARRFEEDDRVAKDGVAAKNLGGPNDTVLDNRESARRPDTRPLRVY